MNLISLPSRQGDRMTKMNSGWTGIFLFPILLLVIMMVHIPVHAKKMQRVLRDPFNVHWMKSAGASLSAEEVSILRELEEQLTQEELDMLIEEIDDDGSGAVDFDEFMELVTGE
jgi:hypothetical protein